MIYDTSSYIEKSKCILNYLTHEKFVSICLLNYYIKYVNQNKKIIKFQNNNP
jgi:hypothetical protein